MIERCRGHYRVMEDQHGPDGASEHVSRTPHWAHRLLGAPWGDAIEIAQDSFSDAWLKREMCRDDWNEPEVFGRWLRGVVLNRYRNWSRSRWRRRFRMVTLGPAALEFAAAPSDPEPSEQVQALRRAIERLPAEQRQVVLMHYLEETSVSNVASLLSVTVEDGRRAALSGTSDTAPTARHSSPSHIGKMLLCL